MPLSLTQLRLIVFALVLHLGAPLAPLHAQTPAAVPGVPVSGIPVPAPPLAAAPAAKRQRLALVVGIGSLGARPVLESARRDSEAVAAALRWGGFDVLLRLDPSGADLRASINEFRDRLQADGIGLIYFTGLAAQVDARNLLLPADVTINDALAAPATAAVLRAVGVPLQELLDALAGGVNSPRLLLVDAAYRHPALARLSPPGLARQRLAPGTMALLGHAPAALQDPPSVTPLPSPPPKDLRDLAVSRFARVVVEALTTPRISVPEALRAVRLAVADSSGGLSQPWLAGDTFAREFLADAALLEGPPPTAASASAPAASTVSAASSAPSVLAAPAAAAAPTPTAAPAVPVATAAVGALATLPAPPMREGERRATDGRTAPAPGRGERPVYQPRISSYGHAEGDTLTYQVTDTRTDELLQSYTVLFEEVRVDGQIQANGGRLQLDAQGRVKSQRDAGGPESTFEPAQETWWARPQAGESRVLAYKEAYVRADQQRGQIDWRGTSQVGSLRQMETPAGDFDVLPIKSTGQAVDTPQSGAPTRLQFTRTVWYAPKLGMPVVIEIEDNDEAGKPLRRERIELTHAQQARTAN